MSRQLVKTMGTLDVQGVGTLLRSAWARKWGGVLRLRGERGIGALWLVKGNLVHAILHDGPHRVEGPAALETILAWTSGAYWAESGALPPARTIRQPMAEILHETPGIEASDPFAAAPLSELLTALRERVPGLESLSVSSGCTLAATTARDAGERDWLDGQLRRYFATDRLEPERLFVQQGDRVLLILSRGSHAAVLAAGAGTTPEALFWAGEEARKRMLTTD